MTQTRLAQWLSDEDKLALLVAALCHDLDHDGHSNSYHVNSGSQLARIYNDTSVLENHHCAMAFAILSRRECNIFDGMAPEALRSMRKKIIAAILSTDMASHFASTAEFQKHPTTYDPECEADRNMLIKIVLHAADIGTAVRPFRVNHIMSRRVHHEFQRQAAAESAQALPVTFSVDTSDPIMCARIETNFLDYVVTALWERLVEVLPELQPRLQVRQWGVVAAAAGSVRHPHAAVHCAFHAVMHDTAHGPCSAALTARCSLVGRPLHACIQVLPLVS